MIEGLYNEGEMAGIFACWYIPNPNIFAGKPALYIDRDGVIVEETNYLCRPEDVSFIPGVVDAIFKINQVGIPVIIVTNQAGIGRGYYGWQDFIKVQEYISEKLKQEGAHFDACIACPYHLEAKEPYRCTNHFFRKPNPGMIIWPARTAGIDLKSSWIVGDKLSDLQAGERAGLGGLAHVMTGHGKSHRLKVIQWFRDKPNLHLFKDLCEAIEVFFNSPNIRPYVKKFDMARKDDR